MLTERRKADREEMARQVAALCAEMGATCEVRDMATYVYSDGSDAGKDSREIRCLIEIGEGCVGIEFDGGHFNTMKDCFCMPWNTVMGSKARMTSAFGTAVGAEVNPFHQQKCMGFADGFEDLLERLRAAMICINAGEAFKEDAA